MEIETRGRKRRGEEESRAGPNPVRRDADGRYYIEERDQARPEVQEALEALHRHWERGERVTMQFDVFPVRGVPQELLLDLVGGDVQTFVALMRADPAMRKTLLPLTPEMVKLVYPEAVLVMAMACERELIAEIAHLNKLLFAEWNYARGYLPELMGLLPYMVNSWNNPARVAIDLEREIRKSLAERRIPALYAALHPFASPTWEFFEPVQAAVQRGLSRKGRALRSRQDEKDRKRGEIPDILNFVLPGADVCRFSHVAAIRICAEVVRIGIERNMRWRVKGERGDYRSFDLWTSRHAQIGILATMRQRRKDDFPLGEETIDRVTTLAGELVVALRGGTQDDDALYDLMSEGRHDATSEEEGPFSVDAAHLIAMIEDFVRRAAELERKVGQLDPLYIDLISMDTLSGQVCLLADARKCDKWWLALLRAIWEGTKREHYKQEHGDESSEEESRGYSTDSRLCCSCRAERATRLDARFALPFCPAERCQRQVFSRLHSAGLWRPEGGVVVK